MSSQDFSQRASRGQAYNLASADALKHDREDDLKYVIGRYYKHLKIAGYVQRHPPEELIEKAGLLEVVEKFKEIDRIIEAGKGCLNE